MGTLFNGVRAIAKEHNVAIARLRRYAHRSAKCHHGYDTDSSALGADSGSDDSGDGDSDATMYFFWGVEEGGLLAGMKRFVPSTCLARAPSFPTVCSHDGDSDATM